MPPPAKSRISKRRKNPLTTDHWSLVTHRGQAALDYAVFIAVVASALIGMQVYIRRAIQANLKTLEDQINAEAVSSTTTPSVTAPAPVGNPAPPPPPPPPAPPAPPSNGQPPAIENPVSPP